MTASDYFSAMFALPRIDAHSSDTVRAFVAYWFEYCDAKGTYGALGIADSYLCDIC